jgi:hypothetical protein
MLKKRSNQVLLAVAGLVIIAVAAYFVFFAGSGCRDCPTFKYFRLET